MSKCVFCEREFYNSNVNTCILHVDKNSPYWSNAKDTDVKKFWYEIREQIKKDINEEKEKHDFTKYRFPCMEEESEEYGFWDNKQKKQFLKPVSFNESTFDQEINFTDTIFHEWVDFTKTNFKKETYFKNLQFIQKNSNKFVKFSEIIFNEKVEFIEIDFGIEVIFEKSTFLNKVIFQKIESNFIIFNNIKFKNDVEILLNSENTSLNQINFIDVEFDSQEDKTSLNFLYLAQLNKIRFENTYFSSINTILIKSTQIIEIYQTKFEKDSIVSLSLDNVNQLEINTLIGDISLKLTDSKILEIIKIEKTNLKNVDFNGLNLKSVKTILLNQVSFLGANLTKVEWGKINEERFEIDRQMARQLKAVNDVQGETIIANKFYTLEMQLHSKELEWKKDFFDKLIHNIHGMVSNHSDDWLLATMWLFTIGLIASTIAKSDLTLIFVLSIPLFMISLLLIGIVKYILEKTITIIWKIKWKINKNQYIAISSLFGAVILFNFFGVKIEYMAAMMNPLNIKDSKDLLCNTNLALIYSTRIITMFIVYQLITAIRKNTRRK